MTEHHTRVKVTLSLYVDLATDSYPEDIDAKLMQGMVEDNVVDAIQNALDGNLRESVSVWLDKYDFEDVQMTSNKEKA